MFKWVNQDNVLFATAMVSMGVILYMTKVAMDKVVDATIEATVAK